MGFAGLALGPDGPGAAGLAELLGPLIPPAAMRGGGSPTRLAPVTGEAVVSGGGMPAGAGPTSRSSGPPRAAGSTARHARTERNTGTVDDRRGMMPPRGLVTQQNSKAWGAIEESRDVAGGFLQSAAHRSATRSRRASIQD